MLIVKIHYGLGNQLFQYALARSLASRKKVDYRLDTTFYSTNVFTDHPRIYQLDRFNIREQLAGREEIERYTHPSFLQRRWRNLESRLRPYYKQRVVNEVRLDFDENIFLVNSDTYLFGYWQDLRYFSEIEDDLKKELTFRYAPEGRNKELLDQIRSSASVSLHIRRGDYLTDSYTVNNVDSCNADYYRRAVEEIARAVDRPVFFIFSDDLAWVRENFSIPFQTVFVDNNPQENAVEDLRLMSNCRFHITANSSFSWWAAWLSGYPDKKVAVPKTWRSKGPDMHIPAGWMAI
jgi:Glycosyl transferase family 11